MFDVNCSTILRELRFIETTEEELPEIRSLMDDFKLKKTTKKCSDGW